jgi:hypothetical protein
MAPVAGLLVSLGDFGWIQEIKNGAVARKGGMSGLVRCS